MALANLSTEQQNSSSAASIGIGLPRPSSSLHRSGPAHSRGITLL